VDANHEKNEMYDFEKHPKLVKYFQNLFVDENNQVIEMNLQYFSAKFKSRQHAFFFSRKLRKRSKWDRNPDTKICKRRPNKNLLQKLTNTILKA
jgi:hypothetical protein